MASWEEDDDWEAAAEQLDLDGGAKAAAWDDDEESEDEVDLADVEPSKPAAAPAKGPGRKKKNFKRFADKDKAGEGSSSSRQDAPVGEQGSEAEKLRLRKLQEDADLQAAMDAFGGDDDDGGEGGDSELAELKAETEAQFMEMAQKLAARVEQFQDHFAYVEFVRELNKSLCSGLKSEQIKQVTSGLNVLYNEQREAERKADGKKKTKKKARYVDKERLEEGMIEDEFDAFM